MPSSLVPSPRRKLVLVGGGNAAHVLTALHGGRGWDVHLVTSQPGRWSDVVRCTETRGFSDFLPYASPKWSVVHEGRLAAAHDWSDLDTALRDASAVLLCGPVAAHRPMLERLLPALSGRRDVLLGTLYAQGGFDWTLRDVLRSTGADLGGVPVFGIKRFPFLCKADEPGWHVRLHGRFAKLLYAVDDPAKPGADTIPTLLRALFDKPVERLPHLLACTLTISNQVLHPCLAYGQLLAHDAAGPRWDSPPAFYGSTNRAGAAAMYDTVMELRTLARRLEPLVGTPLARHLGSEPLLKLWLALRDGGLRVFEPFRWARFLRDVGMVQVFRRHRRIQPARWPTRPADDGRGLVPDYRSRFFTDDLPHGLCVIQGLAELVDVDLPRVREMIAFHQPRMGKSYLVPGADGRLTLAGPDLAETNAPQRYGLTKGSDLQGFLRGEWP